MKRLTPAALWSVTIVMLFGCGPNPQTEQLKIGTQGGQPLYVSSTSTWDIFQIRVCWETSGYATEKAWIRDAIEDSWEAHSLLDFTGWAMCSSGGGNIRVRLRDARGSTTYLGQNLDGARNGVNLNLWGTAASPSSCTPGFTREECIRSTAVHEFGHALGFAHEHNRSDTPGTCTKAPQGSNGDTTVGAWDLDSVMNYCNPVRNGRGLLSDTDIEGLQKFYGDPTNPFTVELRDAATFAVIENSYCGKRGTDIVKVKVTPFPGLCTRARITLIDGGIGRGSTYVSANRWSDLDLTPVSGWFELRVTCGHVTDSVGLARDVDPPTFSSVVLANGSGSWSRNPVRLGITGLRDDGGWITRDYTTLVFLDGRYWGARSGVGADLGTLVEGDHSVRLYVRDKCRRTSAGRDLSFAVDGRPPSVSFLRPSENAMVWPRSALSVEVSAGDPAPLGNIGASSGLRSVKLYLDALPGEFSTGRYLCTFPGPWMLGFATRSSCTVTADWNWGTHKLIAVAKDGAGNERQVERTIRVGLYGGR